MPGSGVRLILVDGLVGHGSLVSPWSGDRRRNLSGRWVGLLRYSTHPMVLVLLGSAVIAVPIGLTASLGPGARGWCHILPAAKSVSRLDAVFPARDGAAFRVAL